MKALAKSTANQRKAHNVEKYIQWNPAKFGRKFELIARQSSNVIDPCVKPKRIYISH